MLKLQEIVMADVPGHGRRECMVESISYYKDTYTLVCEVDGRNVRFEIPREDEE